MRERRIASWDVLLTKKRLTVMRTKLKITTKYALWAFLLMAIVNAPISGILWIGKHIVSLPVNDSLEIMHKHGLSYIFILTCLIAPCVEEFLFRYPITLERKVLLKSFIFGMLLLFVLAFYGQNESSFVWIILSNLCLVSIILYYARKEYSPKAQAIAGYISIAAFTLLHMTNYTGLHWNNFIFTFLQIAPLGILAFFLNKVRVQCGLIYCIGMHGVYNLIVFIMTLPMIK